MDGKFVKNINELKTDYKFNKKLDIHLMVNDIKEYVEKYKKLQPEFITFHLEAIKDPLQIIKQIKKLNIKVGISIKPDTNVDFLIPYLKYIDLVLVMSVEPGYGGQEFIENSISKINRLKQIRENNNLDYLIEVDGGINSNTISKVENADIIVVGSYITSSDNYQANINKLLK